MRNEQGAAAFNTSPGMANKPALLALPIEAITNRISCVQTLAINTHSRVRSQTLMNTCARTKLKEAVTGSPKQRKRTEVKLKQCMYESRN